MRQSNIELCRIASIFLVLIVHSNFAYLGWPNTLEDTTIYNLLLQGLSIIGVNVFILITGYFSTFPKKKSLINLFATIFFYGVLLLGAVIYNGKFTFKSLFLISSSNWFILDYLGLLLLCPFLNSYVDNANKTNFKIALLSLLAYYIWFGYLPGFNTDFNHGYSILSFVIIYLIGRYIRLYGLNWIKHPACIFALCTVALGTMGYISLKYNIGMNSIRGSRWLDTKVFCYNNPIVILSSVSFFMFFVNLKMNPSKFINHVSKSCLAILLIHTSPGVSPMLRTFFNKITEIPSNVLYILTYAGGVLVIFTICVLLDQIRLKFLEILKINK